MKQRRLVGVLVSLVSLGLQSGLGAAPALAGPPDRWAIARDPTRLDAERLGGTARDHLDRADFADDGRGFLPNNRMARDMRSDVRSLLVANGALDLHDRKLRLLLARACDELHDSACVIAALEKLEGPDRDDSRTVHALFSLALAYAKTGRFDDEIRVWERYLALQREPSSRASALSNLAEARMRQLDFVGAIRDYREALDLAGVRSTVVLTHFGLAMALDRSGDLAGAIAESGRALAQDREGFSYLDDPGVFFVPAYDVHWQKALAEMSRPSTAATDNQRADDWDAAARTWDRYISLATAAKDDGWISLAQAHMKLCLAKATTARGAVPRRR